MTRPPAVPNADHSKVSRGNVSTTTSALTTAEPMAGVHARKVVDLHNRGASNGAIIAYLNDNAVPIPTRYADEASDAAVSKTRGEVVPVVTPFAGDPSRWVQPSQIDELLAYLAQPIESSTGSMHPTRPVRAR